jgi:molecular chaperone GrpE
MEPQEHPGPTGSEETPAPEPSATAPAAEGAEESPEKMREAVLTKTQEVERLQERLLRLHAEFENHKKRVAREKTEFFRFATEGLILEFLPVLDNLERALVAARADVGSTPLLEGIEMIARLFRSALEKAGVKPMEALGHPFDPGLHQAVAQVESSQGEANLVVEEIQKGYLLNGRVLRPAMVKVSSSVSGVPDAGGAAEGAQP